MSGSQPDLLVEIALTTDPLNTSPSWTDVSAYVRHQNGVQIQRGRSSELSDFSPGSCTLVLSNRDRRFDPRHATGPYFGNLKPGKRIRVRDTWSAVNYPLFDGFIESWPQEYADGNVDATVTLNCFDGLTVLSEFVQPDPVFVYTLSTIGSCELFLRNTDGTTWFDQSGHGRNATRVNDPTFAAWKAAHYGDPKAGIPYNNPDIAAFYSTSQVGASLAPGMVSSSVAGGRWSLPTLPLTTTYSVSFWFLSSLRSDSTSATYYLMTQLFGERKHSGSVWIEDGAGFGRYGQVDATQGNVINEGAGPYNDGRAHHVVYTVSGNTGSLYIDGVLINTGTLVTTLFPYDCTVVDMTDYKYVAADTFTPTTPATTSTTMQDVAVFSKVLSAGEVLGLYQRGLGQLSETSSARMSRLLASTEWPTAWVSTTTNPKGTCVDYLPAFRSTTDVLAEVAATEQGRIFVDAAGVLQLLGRYYQSEVTAGKTSQATFSDDGTGVPYRGIGTDYSSREVYNDITVVASAGASGSATDATSITAHRRQPQTISTLLPGATDAADMAAGLVAARKDAVTRLSHPLTVQPAAKTTNWPTILGLELGHRVTLKLTPMGNVGSQIVTPMVIEGIAWDITVDDWHVSFDLAPVPFEPTVGTGAGWMVWDDATNGVWGTARWGF